MAKIYQLKRMAIILNRLRDGRSARPDELVEYVSREMELFDDNHSDVSLRTLQRDINTIAELFHIEITYHLFCVPTVSVEDMEALFACKKDFRIRVNNIRYVAVLFDALLEKSLIQAHWQSVLFRGGFLLSKDGRRTVSASSLSTALSAARSHPTSVFYAIRTMIHQLER